MKRLILIVGLGGLAAGCAVSTQQEVELGANYSQQINSQLPIVRDASVNRYLTVLGDSLARVTDNRNLDWHFFIVDSKEVNAFAVPGGYVYVNRGLIERTTHMNQLAGVLGHEIGHVTRRHSVQQMQKAQGANVGVTLACILTRVCNNEVANAAIQVGGTAVFARFSRQDEAEADQEGIKTVVRAGIDPRGIPEMFRILLNERKSNPSGLDAMFATHPLEEDRIQATEATIASLGAGALRGLREDSPAFQDFKRRLASVPVRASR
jgi:beta-barrel assembly-enhancing protease